MRYSIIRTKENMMVHNHLEESKIDDNDIRSIVFDIFSRRKKFMIDFGKRITLYFGFLAYLLRFFRCKSLDFE